MKYTASAAASAPNATAQTPVHRHAPHASVAAAEPSEPPMK